ncbi:MAG: ribbon-helix-helix domain-containing protein [Sphingomonadales bacterium]|nr:ribbon-helix-helix domain-containing protein [Sphingomonadales bacterium]
MKNSTKIEKHSLKIAGHTTSISIEGIFWEVLKDIAKEKGKSLNALVEEIDLGRMSADDPSNLSSSLRVFVMAWMQRKS